MERFQFLKKHKVWFMSVNIFNFLLKNVTTVKFKSKGENFLSVYNDSSLACSGEVSTSKEAPCGLQE